jgi:hypothetical protein
MTRPGLKPQAQNFWRWRHPPSAGALHSLLGQSSQQQGPPQWQHRNQDPANVNGGAVERGRAGGLNLEESFKKPHFSGFPFFHFWQVKSKLVFMVQMVQKRV